MILNSIIGNELKQVKRIILDVRTDSEDLLNVLNNFLNRESKLIRTITACLFFKTFDEDINENQLRILAATEEDSVLRNGDVSAKSVFDAVKAGDKVAIQIATQFGEILGKGLAIIASVLNPEIFVIGGGVSKAGEILFEYIKPAYQKYVFPGSAETEFALATLGNDAGIYGAAKLVL